MEKNKILHNNVIRFSVTFTAGLCISIALFLIYLHFLQSTYVRLLLLYVTPTLVFAACGYYAMARHRDFAASVPLLILAFCWFSLYMGQRVSGIDIVKEYRIAKAEKEAYEARRAERRPEVAQILLQEAEKYMKQEEFVKAEQKLIQILMEFDSTNADAYFTMAELYTMIDSTEMALHYFYEGIKRDSERPEIHKKVGDLNYRHGYLDLAIIAYQVAVYQDSLSESTREFLQMLLAGVPL